MPSKLEYLLSELSRSENDYENYVVNAIWTRLDDPDIKPVAKQYIKMPDCTYIIADLYFPQLNIGVNVDKVHHMSMVAQLSANNIVLANNNFDNIVIPIFTKDENNKKVTLPIEEINKSILECVAKLKDKKTKLSSGFVPW